MAGVLNAGGFAEESIIPACESVVISANALSILPMEKLPETLPEKLDVSLLNTLKTKLGLSNQIILFIQKCFDPEKIEDKDCIIGAGTVFEEAERIINEKIIVLGIRNI